MGCCASPAPAVGLSSSILRQDPGLKMPMRRLIINADDFGDRRFNPAIAEGILGGYISSASLLVGMPGTLDAIDTIRAHNVPVGVHVNLTWNAPVLDPHLIPSLVAKDGCLWGNEAFRRRLAMGQIADTHIVAECRAQVERFISLVGAMPTHVDSHHHVHVEPAVARCLAPILQEFGLARVRVPLEDPIHVRHCGVARREFADRMREAVHAVLPLYAEHGCLWPNHFVGLGLTRANSTPKRVEERLKLIPDGVTEYMVHVVREGHVPRSDPSFLRHHEFDVLSSSRFREFLVRENIALSSFAVL
jgi:predicted glycoside hydrolase/deacetylase ChbG (UPF0249 family)